MKRAVFGVGLAMAALGFGVELARRDARPEAPRAEPGRPAPAREPARGMADRRTEPRLAAVEHAVAAPHSDAQLDQARVAGRSSGFLARLPADDQGWVLSESAAALARGQIELATLPAYVDQLASVREFAVLERTERYINPESFR